MEKCFDLKSGVYPCESSIEIPTWKQGKMVTLTPFKDEVWESIMKLGGIVTTNHTESGFAYLVTFIGKPYGASIIKKRGSYGHENNLFELGVTYQTDDGQPPHLCYNTPITNDVIGDLTDSDVVSLLHLISKLDGNGKIRQPSQIKPGS